MFRPTAMLALVALALPGTAAARGRLLGAFAGTAPVLTDGVRPLAAASPSGHVSYGGGPVMHSTKTFVIYWDPAGALGADYEALVNRYLADVAADTGTQTNVYSVATEYGDSAGKIAYDTSFGGAYVDRTPYPFQSCAMGTLGLGHASCLTDAAIQAEVIADLQVNGWTPGLDRVYFVLTPSGVLSCQDTSSAVCSTSSYCAYHSQVDPAAYPAFPDADPVIYADIPYPSASGCTAPQSPNGSPADSTVNLMSHEHIEMITDPLVDEPGWIDTSDGSEIADKCRSSYGTPVGPAGAEFDQTINGDDYMLQSEFSNAAGACLQRAADDQPPVAEFTSASGDGLAFSFDASASSDPDGHLVSYRWDFGDGTGAAGAQTSHTFGGGGQRTVTLVVGDNAGAATSVAHAITVGSPPPATTPPPTTPPPPAAASPTPTTPTAVTDAPGSTTTAPAAPAVAPASVAPAGVVAPRLSASAVFGALGAQGVAGSFAVDRRAQARVDVLIGRAAAVRLHITARADGGPRSAQVIVGQSVLGARGPGRVAWRVRLTRATLRRLRRAPATVVTVRLTVQVAGEAPRVLSARRHLHA